MFKKSATGKKERRVQLSSAGLELFKRLKSAFQSGDGDAFCTALDEAHERASQASSSLTSSEISLIVRTIREHESLTQEKNNSSKDYNLEETTTKVKEKTKDSHESSELSELTTTQNENSKKKKKRNRKKKRKKKKTKKTDEEESRNTMTGCTENATINETGEVPAPENKEQVRPSDHANDDPLSDVTATIFPENPNPSLPPKERRGDENILSENLSPPNDNKNNTPVNANAIDNNFNVLKAVMCFQERWKRACSELNGKDFPNNPQDDDENCNPENQDTNGIDQYNHTEPLASDTNHETETLYHDENEENNEPTNDPSPEPQLEPTAKSELTHTPQESDQDEEFPIQRTYSFGDGI